MNSGVVRSARAWRMNVVQIGRAASAPVRPSGLLSSIPTQTTVRRVGVKPANHASRRSLEVPVFPAASWAKPSRRAAAAVPVSKVLRSIQVTRNALSARATPSGPPAARCTTSSPAVIRLMACSGARAPRFARTV